MKKIFITILLIINLISCAPKLPPSEKPFRIYDKWPIVELVLNGKKAYFLIDTGSMETLLNSDDKIKYGYIEGINKKDLGGLGGNSTTLDAYHVNLEFNNTQLISDFHSQNLEYLVDEYEEESGIQISGILGTNILDKYHFIIDYSTSTITIQN